MTTLRREPGRVVFTRPGQTPGLHEGIYYFFLLAMGLCSVGMLLFEPFFGIIGSLGAGVGALAGVLLDMSSRVSTGGRLLQIRKHFTLVSPSVDQGYRDAPTGQTLEFDGHRIPQSKVREVVLGHFFNTTGGGARHDFWPVYLVLEDQVIELAVLRDKSSALKLRREIAELFDVPMLERETDIFGVGIAGGCLNGILTIGLDLVLIMLPLLALTMVGERGAVPVPAIAAVLMWLNHRLTPKLFARDIGSAIDEQVAKRFELGPRVRVEASNDVEVEESVDPPAHAEAEA